MSRKSAVVDVNLVTHTCTLLTLLSRAFILNDQDHRAD